MSVLRKILSPESKQHDLRKTHLSQSHRMIIAPGDVEGLLINSCLEIPSEPVSEMQSVMIVNDIDDLNSSIPSTEEDPTLEDSKFQALSISFYNRKENDTCLNRTLMSPSPITALLTPRNMYESNRNTQAETHRERFTQAETHRERYTQAETHRERNTQAENRSNQLSYRATPNMLTGRNTALEKLDKSALYSIAERMVSPVNKSMLNASKIYNRIMQGHKSPTRAEISKEDLKPKPRMAVKGNITNQMIAKLEKQLGKDKSTSSSSSKVSQLTTKPSSRQDIRSTRTKINPDETASFNQGHTISKGKIKLEADLSILSPRTATNQNNTSKLAKNVSKENLLRESASSKFLMYNGKETKKIATRFIELKRNRELEASESSFKKKDASSIINLSQLRKSVERQGGKKPFASPSKKVLQTSILNSISPEKSILKKSSGFQTSREGQSNVQKLALHRLQANISQQQSKKGLVSLRDSSVENGNEHSHDQTRSEQEEFVTTNANLQRTQKSIQTAREDRNPLHSQRGALNFAYGFGSASTKNLPTTSRLKRDESSTDLSLKGNTTERSQKGFSSIKKMIRDESSTDLRSGATTERGGNKREVLVSFKKMIRDESSPELLKKPNTERGPLGRFHENDERKAVVKKDNVRLDEYFEEDGVKFYQYNKVSNKSKNNKENKVMFDSEQNRTKGHTYYNGATGLGARDARSQKGAVQAGNYSYWK